jgi:hypothetical protein
MAELLRIKGQILAAMQRPHRASAADCLMQALAVAREQSALVWEMRSATALARLLAEDGRRDQARDTLAASTTGSPKASKPRIFASRGA